MNKDKLRQLLLEEICSHQGALVELGACVYAKQIENSNPNYLITPVIQLSNIEGRLLRLKDRRERILNTPQPDEGD